MVVDKVFPSLKVKTVYSSKQREGKRTERVQKGARRGLDVKSSITPGATQRNDAHKRMLAEGTGKQQPHLDQFAITEGPD